MINCFERGNKKLLSEAEKVEARKMIIWLREANSKSHILLSKAMGIPGSQTHRWFNEGQYPNRASFPKLQAYYTIMFETQSKLDAEIQTAQQLRADAPKES